MKYLPLLIALTLLLVACAPAEEPTQPEEPVKEYVNTGFHQINISEWHFRPDSITVYEGDRIKFQNDMPFVKRVWIWGHEPSPIIRTGKSWSWTPTEPGFYEFRDYFQQYMDGNITVIAYEERPDIKAKLEQTE
jgi:plastocyanin